jgi:hypothetical protein
MVLALVLALDVCSPVLQAVCDALERGDALVAAGLAAPLALDAAVEVDDRRAAATIASGAWVEEGSAASRCQARGLLTAYLADEAATRTPVLERRLAEVQGDRCDDEGAQPSSVDGPKDPTEPGAPRPDDLLPLTGKVEAPRVARVPLAARGAPAGRRAAVAGGLLAGISGVLVGVSAGSLVLFVNHKRDAQALIDQAPGRSFTAQEEQDFVRALSAAEQARAVVIGTGVGAAVALVAGVVLLDRARKSRVRPRANVVGGGVVFSVRF